MNNRVNIIAHCTLSELDESMYKVLSWHLKYFSNMLRTKIKKKNKGNN
jgi:hypothetical protein